MAVILDGLLLVYGSIGYGMYVNSRTHKISNERVQEIYHKLLTETGQVQDALPLQVDESSTVNAFNDGSRVVIYRGMLNFVTNEDELALVLGHEIAHGMLKHLAYQEFLSSTLSTSEAEANADKMGAVYMLKAGYNVCVARDLWRRMRIEDGNAQGQDHPTFSYRYDELDIGCGK